MRQGLGRGTKSYLLNNKNNQNRGQQNQNSSTNRYTSNSMIGHQAQEQININSSAEKETPTAKNSMFLEEQMSAPFKLDEKEKKINEIDRKNGDTTAEGKYIMLPKKQKGADGKSGGQHQMTFFNSIRNDKASEIFGGSNEDNSSNETSSDNNFCINFDEDNRIREETNFSSNTTQNICKTDNQEPTNIRQSYTATYGIQGNTPWRYSGGQQPKREQQVPPSTQNSMQVDEENTPNDSKKEKPIELKTMSFQAALQQADLKKEPTQSKIQDHYSPNTTGMQHFLSYNQAYGSGNLAGNTGSSSQSKTHNNKFITLNNDIDTDRYVITSGRTGKNNYEDMFEAAEIKSALTRTQNQLQEKLIDREDITHDNIKVSMALNEDSDDALTSLKKFQSRIGSSSTLAQDQVDQIQSTGLMNNQSSLDYRSFLESKNQSGTTNERQISPLSKYEDAESIYDQNYMKNKKQQAQERKNNKLQNQIKKDIDLDQKIQIQKKIDERKERKKIELNLDEEEKLRLHSGLSQAQFESGYIGQMISSSFQGKRVTKLSEISKEIHDDNKLHINQSHTDGQNDEMSEIDKKHSEKLRRDEAELEGYKQELQQQNDTQFPKKLEQKQQLGGASIYGVNNKYQEENKILDVRHNIIQTGMLKMRQSKDLNQQENLDDNLYNFVYSQKQEEKPTTQIPYNYQIDDVRKMYDQSGITGSSMGFGGGGPGSSGVAGMFNQCRAGYGGTPYYQQGIHSKAQNNYVGARTLDSERDKYPTGQKATDINTCLGTQANYGNYYNQFGTGRASNQPSTGQTVYSQQYTQQMNQGRVGNIDNQRATTQSQHSPYGGQTVAVVNRYFYESHSKFISLKKFSEELFHLADLNSQPSKKKNQQEGSGQTEQPLQSIYQSSVMKQMKNQKLEISLQEWFEKLLNHEKAIALTIVDQDLVNMIKTMHKLIIENGHGTYQVNYPASISNTAMDNADNYISIKGYNMLYKKPQGNTIGYPYSYKQPYDHYGPNPPSYTEKKIKEYQETLISNINIIKIGNDEAITINNQMIENTQFFLQIMQSIDTNFMAGELKIEKTDLTVAMEASVISQYKNQVKTDDKELQGSQATTRGKGGRGGQAHQRDSNTFFTMNEREVKVSSQSQADSFKARTSQYGKQGTKPHPTTSQGQTTIEYRDVLKDNKTNQFSMGQIMCHIIEKALNVQYQEFQGKLTNQMRDFFICQNENHPISQDMKLAKFWRNQAPKDKESFWKKIDEKQDDIISKIKKTEVYNNIKYFEEILEETESGTDSQSNYQFTKFKGDKPFRRDKYIVDTNSSNSEEVSNAKKKFRRGRSQISEESDDQGDHWTQPVKNSECKNKKTTQLSGNYVIFDKDSDENSMNKSATDSDDIENQKKKLRGSSQSGAYSYQLLGSSNRNKTSIKLDKPKGHGAKHALDHMSNDSDRTVTEKSDDDSDAYGYDKNHNGLNDPTASGAYDDQYQTGDKNKDRMKAIYSTNMDKKTNESLDRHDDSKYESNYEGDEFEEQEQDEDDDDFSLPKNHEQNTTTDAHKTQNIKQWVMDNQKKVAEQQVHLQLQSKPCYQSTGSQATNAVNSETQGKKKTPKKKKKGQAAAVAATIAAVEESKSKHISKQKISQGKAQMTQSKDCQKEIQVRKNFRGYMTKLKGADEKASQILQNGGAVANELAQLNQCYLFIRKISTFLGLERQHGSSSEDSAEESKGRKKKTQNQSLFDITEEILYDYIYNQLQAENQRQLFDDLTNADSKTLGNSNQPSSDQGQQVKAVDGTGQVQTKTKKNKKKGKKDKQGAAGTGNDASESIEAKAEKEDEISQIESTKADEPTQEAPKPQEDVNLEVTGDVVNATQINQELSQNKKKIRQRKNAKKKKGQKVTEGDKVSNPDLNTDGNEPETIIKDDASKQGEIEANIKNATSKEFGDYSQQQQLKLNLAQMQKEHDQRTKLEKDCLREIKGELGLNSSLDSTKLREELKSAGPFSNNSGWGSSRNTSAEKVDVAHKEKIKFMDERTSLLSGKFVQNKYPDEKLDVNTLKYISHLTNQDDNLKQIEKELNDDDDLKMFGHETDLRKRGVQEINEETRRFDKMMKDLDIPSKDKEIDNIERLKNEQIRKENEQHVKDHAGMLQSFNDLNKEIKSYHIDQQEQKAKIQPPLTFTDLKKNKEIEAKLKSQQHIPSYDYSEKPKKNLKELGISIPLDDEGLEADTADLKNENTLEGEDGEAENKKKKKRKKNKKKKKGADGEGELPAEQNTQKQKELEDEMELMQRDLDDTLKNEQLSDDEWANGKHRDAGATRKWRNSFSKSPRSGSKKSHKDMFDDEYFEHDQRYKQAEQKLKQKAPLNVLDPNQIEVSFISDLDDKNSGKNQNFQVDLAECKKFANDQKHLQEDDIEEIDTSNCVEMSTGMAQGSTTKYSSLQTQSQSFQIDQNAGTQFMSNAQTQNISITINNGQQATAVYTQEITKKLITNCISGLESMNDSAQMAVTVANNEKQPKKLINDQDRVIRLDIDKSDDENDADDDKSKDEDGQGEGAQKSTLSKKQQAKADKKKEVKQKLKRKTEQVKQQQLEIKAQKALQRKEQQEKQQQSKATIDDKQEDEEHHVQMMQQSQIVVKLPDLKALNEDGARQGRCSPPQSSSVVRLSKKVQFHRDESYDSGQIPKRGSSKASSNQKNVDEQVIDEIQDLFPNLYTKPPESTTQSLKDSLNNSKKNSPESNSNKNNKDSSNTDAKTLRQELEKLQKSQIGVGEKGISSPKNLRSSSAQSMKKNSSQAPKRRPSTDLRSNDQSSQVQSQLSQVTLDNKSSKGKQSKKRVPSKKSNDAPEPSKSAATNDTLQQIYNIPQIQIMRPEPQLTKQQKKKLQKDKLSTQKQQLPLLKPVHTIPESKVKVQVNQEVVQPLNTESTSTNNNRNNNNNTIVSALAAGVMKTQQKASNNNSANKAQKKKGNKDILPPTQEPITTTLKSEPKQGQLTNKKEKKASLNTIEEKKQRDDEANKIDLVAELQNNMLRELPSATPIDSQLKQQVSPKKSIYSGQQVPSMISSQRLQQILSDQPEVQNDGKKGNLLPDQTVSSTQASGVSLSQDALTNHSQQNTLYGQQQQQQASVPEEFSMGGFGQVDPSMAYANNLIQNIQRPMGQGQLPDQQNSMQMTPNQVGATGAPQQTIQDNSQGMAPSQVQIDMTVYNIRMNFQQNQMSAPTAQTNTSAVTAQNNGMAANSNASVGGHQQLNNLQNQQMQFINNWQQQLMNQNGQGLMQNMQNMSGMQNNLKNMQNYIQMQNMFNQNNFMNLNNMQNGQMPTSNTSRNQFQQQQQMGSMPNYNGGGSAPTGSSPNNFYYNGVNQPQQNMNFNNNMGNSFNPQMMGNSQMNPQSNLQMQQQLEQNQGFNQSQYQNKLVNRNTQYNQSRISPPPQNQMQQQQIGQFQQHGFNPQMQQHMYNQQQQWMQSNMQQQIQNREASSLNQSDQSQSSASVSPDNQMQIQQSQNSEQQQKYIHQLMQMQQNQNQFMNKFSQNFQQNTTEILGDQSKEMKSEESIGSKDNTSNDNVDIKVIELASQINNPQFSSQQLQQLDQIIENHGSPDTTSQQSSLVTTSSPFISNMKQGQTSPEFDQSQMSQWQQLQNQGNGSSSTNTPQQQNQQWPPIQKQQQNLQFGNQQQQFQAYNQFQNQQTGNGQQFPQQQKINKQMTSLPKIPVSTNSRGIKQVPQQPQNEQKFNQNPHQYSMYPNQNTNSMQGNQSYQQHQHLGLQQPHNQNMMMQGQPNNFNMNMPSMQQNFTQNYHQQQLVMQKIQQLQSQGYILAMSDQQILYQLSLQELEYVHEFYEVLDAQILKLKSDQENKLQKTQKLRKIAFELIRDKIKAVYNKGDERGATDVKVEIYGSMATGLAIDSSDLDILVHDFINQDSPRFHKLSRNEIIEEMQTLHQALNDVYALKTNTLIESATVPVIKLQINLVKLCERQRQNDPSFEVDPVRDFKNDDETKILNIDITLDEPRKKEEGKALDVQYEHLGLQCCKYIIKTLENYPKLKIIALIFKKFLSLKNMNKPFSGGLSSYSLVQMILAVLKIEEKYEMHNKFSVAMIFKHFIQEYGFNYMALEKGIDQDGQLQEISEFSYIFHSQSCNINVRLATKESQSEEEKENSLLLDKNICTCGYMTNAQKQHGKPQSTTGSIGPGNKPQSVASNEGPGQKDQIVNLLQRLLNYQKQDEYDPYNDQVVDQNTTIDYKIRTMQQNQYIQSINKFQLPQLMIIDPLNKYNNIGKSSYNFAIIQQELREVQYRLNQELIQFVRYASSRKNSMNGNFIPLPNQPDIDGLIPRIFQIDYKISQNEINDMDDYIPSVPMSPQAPSAEVIQSTSMVGSSQQAYPAKTKQTNITITNNQQKKASEESKIVGMVGKQQSPQKKDSQLSSAKQTTNKDATSNAQTPLQNASSSTTKQPQQQQSSKQKKKQKQNFPN